MNDYIEVMAIVEGKTEELFINLLVQPYLASQNIFIQATQVSKPGQKGGDIRFERVKKDLGIHLKQRKDTYVTLFVDYYGIDPDWPGLNNIPASASPVHIARTVNRAVKESVIGLFENFRAQERFVPFIAVHEFEALLFSDSQILAASLNCDVKDIDRVLSVYKTPEAINNDPSSAPSKRLDAWSKKGKFAKTTTGIHIAREIGIDRMRKKCPLFNDWIHTFEKIIAGNL